MILLGLMGFIALMWMLYEMLSVLKRMEATVAEFGAEVLAKIEAQTTQIAGVKALVEDLLDDERVPDEVKAEIQAKLDANSATLEQVLAANVPPTEPPPVEG